MSELQELVSMMRGLGVPRLVRNASGKILEVELASSAEPDASYPPSAVGHDVGPNSDEPEYTARSLPSGEPACVRCGKAPPAGLVPGHCRACGKIAAHGN